MKTADITRAVRDHFAERGFMVFTEVRDALGMDYRNSIDLFAIHPWPSTGYRRVSIEVKASIRDFRRELANPEKRAEFARISHEFWFAAPSCMIEGSDVPSGCGLMEVNVSGELKVVQEAIENEDVRDPELGTWAAVARQGWKAIRGGA